MKRSRRIKCLAFVGLFLASFLPTVSSLSLDAPELGEPRVICNLSDLQSCRFLPAEAPGGPALICSRFNRAVFAWEILRVPLEGGAHEVIRYGRQPDVRGSLLAWLGTEPGADGVWLDDLADDRVPTRLTNDLEMSQPSISPDGKTVACSRITPNRTGIYLLHRGRTAPERRAWRDELQPVFGPTPEQILAIKNDQVWLLVATRWEDRVSERLTDQRMLHFDPAWGPRGEWIAYAVGWTSKQAGLGLMHLPSRRGWLPDLGVQGVRSPVISPDGFMLAFIAGEGDETAAYVCSLALE